MWGVPTRAARLYHQGSRTHLLLNTRGMTTRIWVFVCSTFPMRFALVTSALSAITITLVSVISIALLSWLYASDPASKKRPELKIEIKWGESA
jgi:hypothetical protein